MSQATQPNTDDQIDFKELFFSLIEQWKVIFLCILLSLACALLYLQITNKQYQTDALIQIKSIKGNSLAGLSSEMMAMASLAGISGAGVAGSANTQAEIELLKSRTVLGQAIHDLHLDLQIQAKKGIFSNLFSSEKYLTQYSTQGVLLTNSALKINFIKFKIPKNYENKTLLLELSKGKYKLYDAKSKKYLIQGQLNQVFNKNMWEIYITGPMHLEQNFSIRKNSLPAAMLLILKNFDAQEKGKSTGIVELTYQGENKTNIPKILNTVLNIYKQQDIARSATDKDQQVKFLEKQLPDLKADLNTSENQFNQFREKYGTIDVKEESELYLKQTMLLETSRIELQQKQAELSAQYTNEHPAITAINAQLDTINSKINELNSKIKQLPEIQRQYLQYFRDVEIKTQLYTSLLGTYQSLNVAKAGELGKVSIVDYAVEPVKPNKPRKLIILALSIFVGGFIGALIVVLRNLSRSGVRRREDIELLTEIKTYAELVLNHKSAGSSLQSLSRLIPILRYQLQRKQHNVALLSSIVPDQNQTAIVKQIAIFISQTGQKVLLIDSDLKQGQLAQSLNVTAQAGLSEYLRGQAEFNQVIQNTAYANLSIISCGNHSNETSLAMYPTTLAQLLQQAKEQYDYVILSATPILANSDSLNLAQHSGFNLALVQYAKTQLKEIELAKSYFENAGHTIDGIIFDQIPAYQSKNYQN